MVDGWVRATATDPNNSGFFGSVPLIAVGAGQTVLRSWWNLGLYHVIDPSSTYPAGASILRAGVVYDEADLEPLETPTPISNADADWLAITTMNPHIAILARETTNAWVTLWGFPIDLSIKSQRRNDTEASRTLYLAWEMSLLDEVSGFTMTGWNCSMDAYIRTPD
jgi:hypothetical protein